MLKKRSKSSKSNEDKKKWAKTRKNKAGKKKNWTPKAKADKDTKMSKERNSQKQKKLDECSGDDYIPCYHGGYYLCLFDEISGEYTSKCSKGSGDSSLSLKLAKDYCGQCSLSRQFINDSVVREIDPIQGTEYVTTDSGDILKTDYEAIFNEFGFISLAASKNIVVSVECANIDETQGQISIIFESDIDSPLTGTMFHQGSLVVVDGSLFGSCDVAGEASKDFTTNPIHDGFILIETVMASGPTVTLRGEVGSVHYIFNSLFMTSALLQRRNLATEVNIDLVIPIVAPKKGPLKLNVELTFDGTASIDFSKTTWKFLSRQFLVACDFDFELVAKSLPK